MVCPSILASARQARWRIWIDEYEALDAMRDALASKVEDLVLRGGVHFGHPGADEGWGVPEALLDLLEGAPLARLMDLAGHTPWRPLARTGGRRTSRPSAEEEIVKDLDQGACAMERDAPRVPREHVDGVRTCAADTLEFWAADLDLGGADPEEEVRREARELRAQAKRGLALLEEIKDAVEKYGGDPVLAVREALCFGNVTAALLYDHYLGQDGFREIVKRELREYAQAFLEELKDVLPAKCGAEAQPNAGDAGPEHDEPEREADEPELGDTQRCPCCDAEVPSWAPWCPRCGARLDLEFIEERAARRR